MFKKLRFPIFVGPTLACTMLVISALLGSAQEVTFPAPISMFEFDFDKYPTYPEVIAAVGAGVVDDEWDIESPRVGNDGAGPHCGYEYDGVFRDHCEFGNTDSERSIVLLGSSYIQTWLPAFHSIGIKYDWRIDQFAKPGCTPIDVPLHNYRGDYPACDVYRRWALEEIGRLKPDVVFIDGNWDTFVSLSDGTPTPELAPDILSSQLRSTIGKLQDSGATVYVMSTIPKGDMGYDCLQRNVGQATACNILPLQPSSVEQYRLNEITRATTKKAGAIFVDLLPFFCTSSECPAIVNDIPTHVDWSHVSYTYALWLRDALYEICGLGSLPRSASLPSPEKAATAGWSTLARNHTGFCPSCRNLSRQRLST